MSYILDALRRADAERERGRVPTLHAQPALADAAGDEGHDGDAAAARAPLWRWAAGGLLLVLLVLLGAALSQWLSAERAAPPPVQARVEPRVEPGLPPATAPMPLPEAPPPQMQQQQQRAQPPARRVVAPAVQPAAAPASAASERPAPGLAELPEALRRELPKLVASGAMYSETPANRMLIINGQLFHEGDKVAADLLLEQIQLKSAVLSFKGQRYRIDY